MAKLYKYFPKDIPTDATDVYIRILSNDNYPMLAQYNSSAGTFTLTDSGLEYPFYLILSWRYL